MADVLKGPLPENWARPESIPDPGDTSAYPDYNEGHLQNATDSVKDAIFGEYPIDQQLNDKSRNPAKR